MSEKSEKLDIIVTYIFQILTKSYAVYALLPNVISVFLKQPQEPISFINAVSIALMIDTLLFMPKR